VGWALGSRSVALPDRLLVQARAGELVDLGESCLWQRGARSVRSGGVLGWSSLAGGPWVGASCSIYLLYLSTLSILVYDVWPWVGASCSIYLLYLSTLSILVYDV
jgi:hypothetical protein